MCRPTSFKQEGCDAGGCDTKNDEPFTAQLVTDGVVYKCLSGPTRTIEEEKFTKFILDRVKYAVIGMALLSVERRHTLRCMCTFNVVIIIELLSNEMIWTVLAPVLLRGRHRLEILCEASPRLLKNLVQQIQAVIVDISLGWMQDT